VEASPEQLAAAAAAADALSERGGARTRVVGWVHSHPCALPVLLVLLLSNWLCNLLLRRLQTGPAASRPAAWLARSPNPTPWLWRPERETSTYACASCRCALVDAPQSPASAPAPAGSPRCLARTLAQTGRRTVPAARAGTSPCCPATWTWRRRRRTSSWTRASWGSSWPLLTPCAPRHVAALLALQPAQAARPLRLAALCCPRSPRRQQACQSRGCLAVRKPPGRAGRCSGYKQAYFCSTLTLCPAAGRRRVLAARARDRIPVGAHGGGRAR